MWGQDSESRGSATETAFGEVLSSPTNAQGSFSSEIDANALPVIPEIRGIGQQAVIEVGPRKEPNLGILDQDQADRTSKSANLRGGCRCEDEMGVEAASAAVPVGSEPPKLPLLVPESPLRFSFHSE